MSSVSAKPVMGVIMILVGRIEQRDQYIYIQERYAHRVSRVID